MAKSCFITNKKDFCDGIVDWELNDFSISFFSRELIKNSEFSKKILSGVTIAKIILSTGITRLT